MKHLYKRFLSVAMAISLLMSVASAAFASELNDVKTASQSEGSKGTSGSNETSEAEKERQMQEYSEQLKEAIEEQEALQNSLQNANKLVKELKDSKASTQSKINKLNGQLNSIYSKIEELEASMDDMAQRISSQEDKLTETEQKLDDQYDSMKMRIKYIYENGNTGYLNLIFSSKNITSLLNALEYVSMMSSYDKAQMEEFEALKEYQIQVKTELESQYEELEQLKSESEEEQKAVKVLISAKNQEIAEIGEEITDAEAVAKAYEAEVAAQAEILEQIKSLIAAAGSQDLVLNSGVFAWPCPNYKYISSDYGPRKSPTQGASSNHKGVDMAAASGTAILAAESGIVARVDHSGSSAAGKYFIINHGKNANGVTVCSVYMHCSSIAVNEGDVVVRGQTVASVGSTGVSTGPHLHFGVTENGSYVSPWNYLAKP